MSDSTAIALITANFVPIVFVYYYLTKRADDLAAGIVTGVVRGVRVPTQYRTILLYHSWVGLAMGAMSCALLGVLLNVVIARAVTEGDVRTLAYVTAWIDVCGVGGWAFDAIFELRYYRSVLLRQAESE